MKQITKEHILKAIQEIDSGGIRSVLNSSTYDLIYNDRAYPPKLLLSIANRYAGGGELDHNTFAVGQGTPAFNLLKSKGFLMKNKVDVANSSITKFSEAVNEFIYYLKISDSIISKFSVTKFGAKAKYVWISDDSNKIGDESCHYELIERKGTDDTRGVSVEIHFEDKFKKKYYSLLQNDLPIEVYWNDKHSPNVSITYQTIFSYSDPEILMKIEAALVYLEINLGDKVRKIKDQINSIYIKENFIEWFISRDGIENNYFKQQFGGNLLRFKNEIDNYEELYKNNFGSDLFFINPINFKSKIEEIFKNIYSESTVFSEFSQDKGNGRPKAILGKKNYIAFLNEYFLVQTSEKLNLNNPEKKSMALNQILYGPPGTGKTYNTINKAIQIANPNFKLYKDRKAVKKEYERLVEEGQIAFTTFHQSMSYEDFVEGIKPQTKNEGVSYSVKDGIFKNIVKLALSEYIKNDDESEFEHNDFDNLYESFVESIKLKEGERIGIFTTKTGIEMMLVEANSKSILVKYLWDNNRTKDKEANHIFSVSKEKLKKVLLEGIDPLKVKSLSAELFPLIGHIQSELFAVYKSFYDFVIADKGEVESVQFDYDDQSFEAVKEQFDLLDVESIKEKEVKSYVLIIDEINRGNVSQIFGELITLIEDSKRLGAEEKIEVKLTYSKEQFGVPSNLYIIGTMNTADRSVESLDTALRRRFCFEEMLPNLEVLNEREVGGISLKELLKTINNRIEILLDRDHTIGHSYFINVNIEKDLKNTFKNNIIPLLQEYFYGDYEKIGMILGNGFFEEPQRYTKDLFAKFSTQNYPEQGSFLKLRTINESFKIIEALEILLKKEKTVNE